MIPLALNVIGTTRMIVRDFLIFTKRTGLCHLIPGNGVIHLESNQMIIETTIKFTVPDGSNLEAFQKNLEFLIERFGKDGGMSINSDAGYTWFKSQEIVNIKLPITQRQSDGVL
jgi:hypothetical protein